jgi:hypothetical protein
MVTMTKQQETSDKVLDYLRVSVRIMRDNLDELQRSLDMADRGDEDMIRYAVHVFAWGNANAHQGIENALNTLHYRRLERGE